MQNAQKMFAFDILEYAFHAPICYYNISIFMHFLTMQFKYFTTRATCLLLFLKLFLGGGGGGGGPSAPPVCMQPCKGQE